MKRIQRALILITLLFQLQAKVVEPGKEKSVEGVLAAKALPKEIQRQIIKLKAQVASAEDAALDALDLAESKEKEALNLDKTIADLTKKISDIMPLLKQSQKEHEETNSKETALTKEVADLKQKAADFEREAAEKSQKAAQARKEAADQIADAAAKKQALEDAEKEKADALKLAKEAEDKKAEAAKAAELAQKQKKENDAEKEKIEALIKKQINEQQNLANKKNDSSILQSFSDMANKISEARDALNKIKVAGEDNESSKPPQKPTPSQQVTSNNSAGAKPQIIDQEQTPVAPNNPSKPIPAFDEQKPIVTAEKPVTPEEPTIQKVIPPAMVTQPQLSDQERILQLLNASISTISSIVPANLSQDIKNKQWDVALKNLTQASNISAYSNFTANNKNALKDLQAKITKLFVDIYKAILKSKKRVQLKLFESMTQEWTQNPLGIKIMELEKRPAPDYKKTVESLSSKLW